MRLRLAITWSMSLSRSSTSALFALAWIELSSAENFCSTSGIKLRKFWDSVSKLESCCLLSRVPCSLETRSCDKSETSPFVVRCWPSTMSWRALVDKVGTGDESK